MLDYWALGHVHTRQILLSDHPTVVYPGNPQGRHPNERGARGVYLVEVDELGNASLEFMPIDTVRWESLELDIRSSETEQALLDQLETAVLDTLANADGRSVVARIKLSGRGPMHDSLKTSHFSPDKLTEQLNDTWAHEKPFMWCERVVDETSSELDREELQSGTDFIADLLQLRDQARHDEELLTRISAGLDSLYSHNQYAQYLSEIVPKDDDLNSLIDEAGGYRRRFVSRREQLLRIESLHINGFGHYSNHPIGPLSSPITVLYGANEAGKSTLQEFVRTILFGFSEQKR